MKRMNLIKEAGFTTDLTAQTIKALMGKETAVAQYVVDKCFSQAYYGIYASETHFTVNAEKMVTKKEIAQIQKMVGLEYVEASTIMIENNMLAEYSAITTADEIEEEPAFVAEKKYEAGLTDEEVAYMEGVEAGFELAELLELFSEDAEIEEVEAGSLTISTNNSKEPCENAEAAIEEIEEHCKREPESWVRIFVDGNLHDLDILKEALPEYVKPHEVSSTSGIALSINIKPCNSNLHADDWERAKAFINQAFIVGQLANKESNGGKVA